VGATSLMRAVVTALAPEGIGKLGWGQLALTGLIGYGALVAEAHRQGESPPKPGRIPWEHLSDLAALSEHLGAKLG
jgi:hypothetical protein